MEVEIKKTTDHQTAFEVVKSSKDYFESSLPKIRKELKVHLLYGAFVNDKLVGFVTYKETNKDAVEMSWIAVSPKYRNNGIGTKLVTETLDILKNKYKVCMVKTLAETRKDEGYAKTRNFYKKLGFVSLEIIDPYPGWGEGNPCQIFIKFLGK